LLEKDATVVIRDYCLSACANYIFVATRRTHILKKLDRRLAWGTPTCRRQLRQISRRSRRARLESRKHLQGSRAPQDVLSKEGH
jgi:hypothetical protein